VAGIIILIVAGAVLIVALVLWLFAERWRLLRRSTWEGLKAHGVRNVFKALHMYIYGRWPNQYIKILFDRKFPRLDSKGREHWADHYHAKVLTPELAQAIITHDHDIPLHDLEQIIPYPVARNLVLDGTPDVAVLECPCRHRRQEPCHPTQVCMLIGQPFVNFMLEHQPHTCRQLTQPEALEVLKAEHERWHIHTAWFKDVCLDRFYVICNCCKCCCGGIEVMLKYDMPMLASSGYVAQIDKTRCAGCAICEEACPFEAIQMYDDTAVVNWDACMGCGACEGQCPEDAVSMVRDEEKGIPLDVRLLGATRGKLG
jgi:NAD-dependent dihydropyrimidine dehydrogenase PreA subunit